MYVVNLAACLLSEQVPVKCEKNPQRPYQKLGVMKKFFAEVELDENQLLVDGQFDILSFYREICQS